MLKIKVFSIAIILSFSLLLFCHNVTAQIKEIIKKESSNKSKKTTKTLYGQASYYSKKFEGRKTASGQKFSHVKFTAACNSLPIGTSVRVTNLKNGKTIIVQINDRLHKKTKRLIDLTTAGAKKLGFLNAGLAKVKIEVLGKYRD